MADILKKTSRSATNSPIMLQKQSLVQPPASSHSVSSSPHISRSRSRAQRLLENEKLQEEARQLLLNGHQKVVIIPMGKNGCSNGRSTPKIKVCSTSATNSSDSSDGKRTPPRRKRTHTQGSNGSGNLNPKPIISKNHSWRPNAAIHNSRAQQYSPSLRSLKTAQLERPACHGAVLPPSPSLGSFTYSDMPVTTLRPLSDVVSVRSLISIGMGSTDGKKLVIRRVPTSPSDLLNYAHTSPCGETEEDGFSSCSTLSGTLPDIHDYKSRRRYWPNKLQFILACVGYSIGLGNLWRFPYLCYKSGGGAFLIPYFLILFTCGIPLLYMELAVGQFTKRGPIGALSKLCPILKGAGISSVVVSFFLSTYYNVIIAYTLFYLFSSFRKDPPWGNCNNRWNSPDCWIRNLEHLNRTRPAFPKTPEEEFYMNKLLQSSAGFDSFGQMRWELVACLFIVWVLVYFALWKSVRSSGKVLYFTATVPFVLVLIFLGQALSLEGSNEGLKYLFTPNWELLYDSKVWVYAAAQNFNSIGIAFGSIISFASYNKYNNQILHDTLTVSCINGVTSLLTAVFAFAIIGNIAWDQQEEISKVISDGPGLIFIVYPQFLYKMPLSFLFSSLFFFTLLCLCLNSQFAIVEVTVTSIQDGFPNWIKRKLVCHEILVLVVCLVSFIIGLPNVSQGGIYFFQLIDHYVASVSIIYIAFFEVIAVTWIYGADRLSENIEKMTKYRPGAFFITCWRVVTPLLLMCLWIFSLIDYKPPTLEGYSYPLWAEILGWIFTSVTLISVPIFAVYVILNSDGDTFSKKLLNSIKPRMDDYYGPHSDGSQDRVKDAKELETLNECKIPEKINLNSNNSQLHEQPISNKENLNV